MKILKYKYNPNKKGVFRVSIVKNPAVGEGDLVLMNAVDLENGDAPIVTYADMLVKNPEGKVLLLKRNSECEFEPNKWGFPGGKVMPGETTMNGAVRECLEECGIIINPESVIASGEVVNDDKTSSHYFTGTPTNELKLGDEHQDYAWVEADDLDDYELILDNKERFSNLISGKVVMMASQKIKGVFYAPVMIPDLRITRIDEDTQEKYQVYYDAETVEQLANNYFKQCGNRNTNLDHEDNDIEGVYPVESWIVKDPENDKSKALGMPAQKIGTWIMGYKADNPEVLEKVKNNLLQGLSIEGHLDAEEEVNVKFNKQQTMFETLKKGIADLFVKMEAEGDTKEKTAEELAAEESAKKVEQDAAEEAAKLLAQGDTDLVEENATLKAENEELKKQVSDLEAELATYKNESVLMAAQVKEVGEKLEAYKAVKMSAQKLGDQPKPAKDFDKMTPLEKFRANK